MSENHVQITILLKDMDPIDVICEIDSPLLQQICHGLASKDARADEIMYLQLTGEEDEFLYFPKSALRGIRSDRDLPAELFQDPRAMVAEDYTHLDIDRQWVDWAIENLEKGYEKRDLNRILLDQGMKQEDISELLDYFPDQPVEISESKARRAIEPRLGVFIPAENRIDSDYIELYEFNDFLTDEQCDAFEKLVSGGGSRSRVVSDNPIHESRTSHSYYFEDDERLDPLVRETQSRLCALVGMDTVNSEPLQCQIYTTEQRYKAHHDYFTVKDFPDYAGSDGRIRNGQRQWSAVVYLRDGEPGSGTLFPKIRREFAPKRGTALLWNNLYPDGKPNPYTLHCGLPAGKEKKLVLTQWIRCPEPDQPDQ